MWNGKSSAGHRHDPGRPHSGPGTEDLYPCVHLLRENRVAKESVERRKGGTCHVVTCLFRPEYWLSVASWNQLDKCLCMTYQEQFLNSCSASRFLTAGQHWAVSGGLRYLYHKSTGPCSGLLEDMDHGMEGIHRCPWKWGTEPTVKCTQPVCDIFLLFDPSSPC